MGLQLLAHYNVRTRRLKETRDFYVDVMGLTEGARPQCALPSRHRRVPSLGLYQIFVDDPNGITLELNFPAAEAPAERDGAAGMTRE